METTNYQESKKASVRKIGLNYGLLLSLATITLSIVVYVMGLSAEQPWWKSLLNFVFMGAIIYMGLKAFRTENGGFLSLGDALKTGLAISLIAGIIGAIFTYIFVNFIEPDFIANLLVVTREKMITQNPNMTQDQVDTAMGYTEKFMSPFIMTAIALIASLFFGFIISLIEGLILKKDRPTHL